MTPHTQEVNEMISKGKCLIGRGISLNVLLLLLTGSGVPSSAAWAAGSDGSVQTTSTWTGKAMDRAALAWEHSLISLTFGAMLDVDGNTAVFDELVGRWNLDKADIGKLIELARLGKRIEKLEKGRSYDETLPGRMAASGYATLYTAEVSARRASGLSSTQAELNPLLERRQVLVGELRRKLGPGNEKAFHEWTMEQRAITLYYQDWFYRQWSKDRLSPLPAIEQYGWFKRTSARLSNKELGLKRKEWQGRFERVKDQGRKNEDLWRQKRDREKGKSAN